MQREAALSAAPAAAAAIASMGIQSNVVQREAALSAAEAAAVAAVASMGVQSDVVQREVALSTAAAAASTGIHILSVQHDVVQGEAALSAAAAAQVAAGASMGIQSNAAQREAALLAAAEVAAVTNMGIQSDAVQCKAGLSAAAAVAAAANMGIQSEAVKREAALSAAAEVTPPAPPAACQQQKHAHDELFPQPWPCTLARLGNSISFAQSGRIAEREQPLAQPRGDNVADMLAQYGHKELFVQSGPRVMEFGYLARGDEVIRTASTGGKVEHTPKNTLKNPNNTPNNTLNNPTYELHHNGGKANSTGKAVKQTATPRVSRRVGNSSGIAGARWEHAGTAGQQFWGLSVEHAWQQGEAAGNWLADRGFAFADPTGADFLWYR